MPTKGDNILNNIDFSYSKPFYDSIGFYANIWYLFSVESQHNTLKINEFELKGWGLENVEQNCTCTGLLLQYIH